MKKHKKISQKMILIEETEALFQFTTPRQLKKSLNEVYSAYLQNLQSLDFKEIAADIYFLNKFLEKAEEMEDQKE